MYKPDPQRHGENCTQLTSQLLVGSKNLMYRHSCGKHRGTSYQSRCQAVGDLVQPCDVRNGIWSFALKPGPHSSHPVMDRRTTVLTLIFAKPPLPYLTVNCTVRYTHLHVVYLEDPVVGIVLVHRPEPLVRRAGVAAHFQQVGGPVPDPRYLGRRGEGGE